MPRQLFKLPHPSKISNALPVRLFTIPGLFSRLQHKLIDSKTKYKKLAIEYAKFNACGGGISGIIDKSQYKNEPTYLHKHQLLLYKGYYLDISVRGTIKICYQTKEVYSIHTNAKSIVNCDGNMVVEFSNGRVCIYQIGLNKEITVSIIKVKEIATTCKDANCIFISVEFNIFGIGFKDGTVLVCGMYNLTILNQIKLTEPIQGISQSKQCLFIYTQTKLNVYSLNCEYIGSLDIINDRVLCHCIPTISYSEDIYIVTGNAEGEVSLWILSPKSTIYEFIRVGKASLEEKEQIISVVSVEQKLWTLSDNGSIYIWEMDENAEKKLICEECSRSLTSKDSSESRQCSKCMKQLCISCIIQGQCTACRGIKTQANSLYDYY